MRRSILLPLTLLLIWTSCENNEPLPPTDTFTRIYGNAYFEDFKAVDVLQLQDSGFVILGNEARHPYLMQIGKRAAFRWDTYNNSLLLQYTGAIANLHRGDSANFLFFAQKDPLTIHLLSVNGATQEAAVRRVITGNDIDNFEPTVPLHSSNTPDGGVLLLANEAEYDIDNPNENEPLKVWLVKYNANFEKEWSRDYIDVTHAEDKYTNVNTDLLFTGSIEGRYWFNDYYNGFISLVFVDPANGNALNAILPDTTSQIFNFVNHVEGSVFSFAVSEGENTSLIAQLDLDVGFGASVESITRENRFYELISNSKVYSIKVTENGQDYIIFIGNSRSNQIVLFSFDIATNQLIGKRYLGDRYSYTVESVIKTQDGGLMILATTNVIGRFDRITTFKVSEDYVRQLLNL